MGFRPPLDAWLLCQLDDCDTLRFHLFRGFTGQHGRTTKCSGFDCGLFTHRRKLAWGFLPVARVLYARLPIVPQTFQLAHALDQLTDRREALSGEALCP